MLSLRYLSLLLGGILLVSCGQSAETLVQSPPSAAEQETNWTVNPDESFIRFTAQQQGKEFEGEFTEFNASILFNPDNLEDSEVTVTIPVKAVDAGDKDRNDTLPSKTWFSAKEFPVATFRSDQIAEVGQGSYIANGSLSMKGMTHDIELPFTLSPAEIAIGETTVMTGVIGLDRTQWKIGEDPWNTGEWVSKGIKLNIQITATRQ